MMIDALLQFSEAQDVKTTATSTNFVDLKQANPDMGLWEKPLFVVVAPTTDFAGTGAKLSIELQDCDKEGGTYATIQTTGPLDVTKIVATAPVIIPMPTKHRRYLKLKYTVTGTLTAGAVSAYLTHSVQSNTNWMPGV